MATIASCCVCSSLFSGYDGKSEKPLLPDHQLPCCHRQVCTRCTAANPRYKTYCPYCQTTTVPSVLPQGLKEPPAYHHLTPAALIAPSPAAEDESPPPYATHAFPPTPPLSDTKHEPAPDVLHFLHPSDTLTSLSLAYNVPAAVLRRTNSLFADHLIRGRKTLLIPGGEWYQGGVSLSPQPIDGEEEEMRKSKLRRWMMATKCPEYDIAQLYLEHNGFDIEEAIQAYREDGQWEKDHPLKGQDAKAQRRRQGKGVGMRRFVGTAPTASASASTQRG